ncbi:hypothetical protein BOTBODRAFT_58869 [Botryobasidium botryosum FD-172 SS1]|uniref:Mitochondrial import inner membrane translocase subunit n=1 Tax=Botryobasidium botryosum (strain FD-172 SS1) TaxID=930990 RepID=A0A067MBV1_BOTB1|nr:hypothetical protein BOTBODRAFT_58869 [Botryobasidium botryosum FD-172 SS1]
MDSISSLGHAEQAALNRIIEKKQMQDFMKLYSGLVERCFNSCVTDFNSGTLATKEDACVNHCVDKFLKHSERTGARFAEHNAEQMKGQQPPR